MSDYMAQMLNELMGPQRNALPGEQVEVEFDHPDVCKDFLVGFCPYDAFRNTKNDLGFCPVSIHDEGLRKAYRDSKRKGRLGYEEKFYDHIRRLNEEVRRKINKNETRLNHTQLDTHVSVDTFERKRAELNEKRDMITRKIEALMDEAQIEGERGNVGAAQTAVDKADELTREKTELAAEEAKLDEEKRKAMTLEDQVTAGNKQMKVCQVCGCFMLTNDAQSRIDDHLAGKLHIAYKTIQDHLELYEKEREERRKSILADSKDDKDKEKPEKEREKDRDRKDSKDRDRDRKESKDKDRDRKESKDRDRERDRDRRDRDRKSSRRSRSRSRDRRDRDRDRSDRDRRDGGDRHRDRRDRSRDRDRDRRRR